jgi:cyclic pyranopterin phosphate synthase
VAGTLRDAFGRVADDLRVSVTDRCNLRCRYCIPVEPERWLARGDIATYEELARLVRVAVREGVRTVRLTGGEPLLRRDLATLVRLLRAIEGLEEIALTTNGILLAEQAAALAAAGVQRINVSLDTLRPDRFTAITQRGGHEQVLAGLAAARAAGLDPVKVNAVAIRGFNDDELVDFAAWARAHDWHLRFIEYMPLENGPVAWTRERVLGGDEILETIGAVFPLAPLSRPGDPSPATTFRFADGAPGSIGVITSVTAPFCRHCTRLRLTADGKVRNCLFAMDETDLLGPLRAGADDAALAALMRSNVARKGPGGCESIHATGRALPLTRTMHQIGG